MNRKPHLRNGDDMREEYDFSNAVRGKYYEQYRQGTNVVLLEADVAEVFSDSAAVNDALRLLVALADAKASRRQKSPIRPNKALQPTSRATRKVKPKPVVSRAARG
jgi:hypothetical protein